MTKTRFVWIAAIVTGPVFLGLIFPQASMAQTRYFSQTVFGLPETVEQLSTGATIIVDAHVQSLFPSSIISRNSNGSPTKLETDALLRINRVFKGPNPGAQIVVSQVGGQVQGFNYVPIDYSMLQQGERYLLFLTVPPKAQSNRDRGIPRYEIFAYLAGLLEFTEGGFRASSGMARYFHQQIENKHVDQVIAEVKAFVESQ